MRSVGLQGKTSGCKEVNVDSDQRDVTGKCRTSIYAGVFSVGSECYVAVLKALYVGGTQLHRFPMLRKKTRQPAYTGVGTCQAGSMGSHDF